MVSEDPSLHARRLPPIFRPLSSVVASSASTLARSLQDPQASVPSHIPMCSMRATHHRPVAGFLRYAVRLSNVASVPKFFCTSDYA